MTCALTTQSLIDSTVVVKIDVRWGGWVARGGLALALARRHLKHAIDHANVQVHMPVQVGAEAVNEGDRTHVHCGFVQPQRTGAVNNQACAMTRGKTGSVRCTAVSTMRLVLHDGQPHQSGGVLGASPRRT